MIQAKLLEFQKKGITIEKDGKNPHFGNEYSTLNEVLGKIKKELNSLGIVVYQTVSTKTVESEGGLTTILYDTEDKTFVESTVPFVGATDMQKLGGAITYARRYSLIALLGLEDDDDDGTTASKPSVKKGKATGADDFII